MPLVRIDLGDCYTYARSRIIADAIHEAIVETYSIPVRDRFQILNRLPAGSIIAEDAGLGFERSNGVVMIQIFTQRGRSQIAKMHLYASIGEKLGKLGVAGSDIFIGYQENGAEDWSFGFGKAQYLTGELQVPASI